MEEQQYGNHYLSGELFEEYSNVSAAVEIESDNSEDYAYMNAATCPDCGGSMVRMGGCTTCQSCGFGTCSF